MAPNSEPHTASLQTQRRRGRKCSSLPPSVALHAVAQPPGLVRLSRHPSPRCSATACRCIDRSPAAPLKCATASALLSRAAAGACSAALNSAHLFSLCHGHAQRICATTGTKTDTSSRTRNAGVYGALSSSGTGTRTPNSTSRVSRVANYTIPDRGPKDSRPARARRERATGPAGRAWASRRAGARQPPERPFGAK